jgi:hypothetical protein
MIHFLLRSKPTYSQLGILVLRLALGISMAYHGYLKFMSGAAGLYKVGAMLAPLGVPGYFEVFGTFAAFSELLGGILVALGLFTRLGSVLLAVVLFTATILHWDAGFFSWDYPSQMGFAALAIFCIGGGRYSVDYSLFGK